MCTFYYICCTVPYTFPKTNFIFKIQAGIKLAKKQEHRPLIEKIPLQARGGSILSLGQHKKVKCDLSDK